MNNGLIARELASDLAGHAFTEVDVVPQVRVVRTLGAAHEWLFRRAISEFVRTGALTEAEGIRLLDDLVERDATGRYLLASNYYLTVATAG